MINISFDLSQVLDLRSELTTEVQRKLNQAAQELSLMTHTHIVEQVQEKLHSTRGKYLENLSMHQVNQDTWVIVLDQKAFWIEDGMESHSMAEALLSSSKAKTSKDGSKYLSVPFQHNKGPTSQTPEARQLTSALKAGLKQAGVPYGKIEKHPDGSPKLGLLHKLNLPTPPKTHEGVGQGQGAIGAPKQGHTGIPYLQGVRIYQKEFKTPKGDTKVARSVMTFRTVSSKDIGTDRWVHPGLEPKNFLSEACDWAEQEWTRTIMPKLMRDL